MNKMVAALQTENETLRQRLQDAENTLRAIFEQTCAGIAETDIQGRFILVNDRYCEIVGYTRTELLGGMCWQDITHPEDLPVNLRFFARAAEEGKLFEMESRYLRRDGSIVWVHNAVSVFNGPDRQMISLNCMAIDISQRKRADEERDKFVRLVEYSGDFIAMADLDGRLTYLNSAGRRMIGLSEDQDPQKLHCTDYVAPDWLEPFRTTIIPTVREQGRWVGEMQLRNLQTGAIIDVSRSIFLVPDASGQAIGFGTVTHDITERLQAESVLRERVALQEQLAKIAATVPGVICSFRLRPDGSAGMPYASPAFEDIYGLRRDEVVEDFTPIFDRIHPDDIEQINHSIAESARTMTAWRGTFRYRHPGKGEIWIEGHSMPKREPDGSIFWDGYIQDITERKLKEREISQLNQYLRHRLEEMKTVFETAPIGLSIAEDPEGRHIRGNPASEHLLGLPSGAELSWRATQPASIRISRNGNEMPVDDLPMQRAVRGETVAGQIIEVVRTDGQKLALFCNAAPLFDDLGHPRGAVGAFLDITALKQAEQKLRQSEQFKQAVLDALPASIAVLDRHGVIRSVNQPWLRFAVENGETDASKIGAGVNYLDACRHTLTDSNGYAEAALKGIDAVLRGEQTYFELEYPCHSPAMERWFLMQVVQPSAEIGGAIVIHLDISERKRAQAEIERHVRDLLAANEELARFNRAAVGRELRMIELKKQVNELCVLAGQPPRYRVDFDLPAPSAPTA